MTRVFLWWLVGWLLACGGCGHSGGPFGRVSDMGPLPWGASQWLLFDRARNVIYGLDDELHVRRRFHVSQPVAGCASVRGLWVGFQPPSASGPLEQRLGWVDMRAGGAGFEWEFEVGEVLGMASPGMSRAIINPEGESVGWALARDRQGTAILELREWGIGRRIPWGDLDRIACASGMLWLVDDAGAVWRFPQGEFGRGASQRGMGQNPRIEAWALPGPIRALHWLGGEPWFRLRLRGSPWVSLPTKSGPEPASRHPWVRWAEEPRSPFLRAIAAAAAAVPDGAGGVLWIAPEFVWWSDERRRPRLGQGGFGFLTGAIRWPTSWSPAERSPE